MIREIKFKAQKIHNNEAVYFDLKHFLENEEATMPNAFQYVLKNIRQFTGMYDKTGKEVYEGDVIELNNCGLLVVCFYKGEFKLQKLAEYQKKRNIYASISYLEFGVLRGNIYENPELLTI